MACLLNHQLLRSLQPEFQAIYHVKTFLCRHIVRCSADHCESIAPLFGHDDALGYRSEPDELWWGSPVGMLARIHEVGQEFTEVGCVLLKVFCERNGRPGDFTTKEAEVNSNASLLFKGFNLLVHIRETTTANDHVDWCCTRESSEEFDRFFRFFTQKRGDKHICQCD